MSSALRAARPPLLHYAPLVLAALLLVALTPINTDLSYQHTIQMGSMIGLAVLLPYVFSRYVYRDGIITFPLGFKRDWVCIELLYIGATAIIAYFLLPYYLTSTGVYHNWTVLPGFGNALRLLIGTEALGLWDELFFVLTILTILRRYMPFWYANIVQAILWTAFLYQLSFRSWGPVFIFVFALLQGYIFLRTKSLLYLLSIHLTLDFILFLVLVHTHNHALIDIFVTG